VVSKVCDGKGAIFLLNYQPGERVFSLKLAIGGAGPATIRRVYPDRGAPMATQDGWTVEARVGGESVVILELNRAMKNLPPENRRRFPVEIADWKASGARREGIFLMPDVKALLAKHTDPSLPARLLSLEQAAQTRPDLVAMVRVRPGEEPRSLVQWLGRGPLPEPFLAAYGFDAAHATVETWKVVPWAYADRVWVVYRPEKPIPLSAKPPRLTLNGQAVALWPRVDYRPKNVAAWTCPLLFADITGQVRYGAPNAAALDGAPETTPACYVTSGVGQD
jgi:hypothetical protein